MKRTPFVWVMSIYLLFNVLFSLTISLILAIAFEYFFIITTSVLFIVPILMSIAIYYFFKLKEKTKLWLHLSFGLMILFLFYIPFGEIPLANNVNIFSFIYSFLITCALWFIIIKYISDTKVDGKKLFN
ncbi:MAG: hypothetical protein AB7V77_00510 [Candidatus Woesearchaeota archaeon]